MLTFSKKTLVCKYAPKTKSFLKDVSFYALTKIKHITTSHNKNTCKRCNINTKQNKNLKPAISDLKDCVILRLIGAGQRPFSGLIDFP